MNTLLPVGPPTVGQTLSRPARLLPWALGLATVTAQILFPLLDGGAQDRLAVVTVLLFFGASVGHCLAARGPRQALALVALTGLGGLAVESVGVRTGVPFGNYAYGDRLGFTVLGVPAIIPLAWTMMAYPALLVARRVLRPARAPVAGPLLAGAALASWDLFLDPQMVAAGYWTWVPGQTPALAGIPLVNFLGWYATAIVLAAALWLLLPDRPEVDDRLPYALYLWTYGASVLAHAVFLRLPASAVLGGVGMGAVVAAFLIRLRR